MEAETAETVEAPGAPGAVRAVSSPSGVEAARAPVEILVAEDNELNADIISSILTEEGFSITVAENGEEAVRLFSESPAGHFAAILMDAQMPVMDGYEASRAIRDLKRADAKTVRIFACTASTFAEDRNRALASGMDDFLSKPLNVTVMLQKLEAVRKERCLMSSESRRTHRRMIEPALSPTQSVAPPIPRRGMTRRAFCAGAAFLAAAGALPLAGCSSLPFTGAAPVRLVVKVPRTGHDVVFDDSISQVEMVIQGMADEFQRTYARPVDVEVIVFEQKPV